MILAVESCHKFGFIHRDIKPDVTETPAGMPPSPYTYNLSKPRGLLDAAS